MSKATQFSKLRPVFTSHTVDAFRITHEGPRIEAVQPVCDEIVLASDGLLDCQLWQDRCTKGDRLFLQIHFESAPDVELLATDRESIIKAVLAAIRNAADAIEVNLTK